MSHEPPPIAVDVLPPPYIILHDPDGRSSKEKDDEQEAFKVRLAVEHFNQHVVDVVAQDQSQTDDRAHDVMKNEDTDHDDPSAKPEDDRGDKDEEEDPITLFFSQLLAKVEKLSTNELDEDPDQPFRFSKIRSNCVRLYVEGQPILPWIQDLYSIAIWEDPYRTARWLALFLALLFAQCLGVYFFGRMTYAILRQYLYPPSTEEQQQASKEFEDRQKLAREVLQKLESGGGGGKMNTAKKSVMMKTPGLAGRVKQELPYSYGYSKELMMIIGDTADLLEKVSNLKLWRRPLASRRCAALLGTLTLLALLLPTHLVVNGVWAFSGLLFFGAVPLIRNHTREARILLLWLFGAPTHSQYAMSLLRERDDGSEGNTSSTGGGNPDAGANTLDAAAADPEPDVPYACTLQHAPGVLTITPETLSFTPKLLGWKKEFATTELAAVRKTESWAPRRKGGLRVEIKGGQVLAFKNMARRDAAFGHLLAVGDVTWVQGPGK